LTEEGSDTDEHMSHEGFEHCPFSPSSRSLPLWNATWPRVPVSAP